MVLLYGSINKDYAWEFSAFHCLRDFSDGISLCELNISWDRYLGDHSPSFNIMCILFNFKIFEFNIHYKWHRYNNEE
jgi:hypothetical protein